MQIVDGLAQRQNSAGAVDRHIAAYFQAHGIDKNRPILRRPEHRVGKHHARGFTRDQPWSYSLQTKLVPNGFLRDCNLLGQRLSFTGGIAKQRMFVQHVFELRCRHVERSR
ncbi:hypothetical protein D3C81_1765720 [compost metagenome]